MRARSSCILYAQNLFISFYSTSVAIHEVLHSMHGQKCTSPSSLSLKLRIKKNLACDKLEPRDVN